MSCYTGCVALIQVLPISLIGCGIPGEYEIVQEVKLPSQIPPGTWHMLPREYRA